MHHHFTIHKPCGILSQFTGEKKKTFLGSLYDFPEGTMAVGRLDEESEGLLLLTTSGIVSERVRSAHFEKEYYVMVDGIITDEAIEKLSAGVEIGIRNVRYTTKPCPVRRLDPPPLFPARTKRIRDMRHGPVSWISITLTEGKFRQIRKMTAAAGFPTLRLIRVRIGDFTLGDMKPGEVREVMMQL